MEYMFGLDGMYIKEDSAVTLGKFDGLHRGHQKLISRIRQLESKGCKSVVFTLNSRREKGLLLTDEERREQLEGIGISYLIDCPFVPEIAGMEPEEFVERILVERLHARYLVVGEDFRFGHNRKGDCQTLLKLQKKYGFQVEVVPKESYEDRKISSTYVREALASGDMELVHKLLGYPYYITGEVLHGKRLGRTLGMPTTNLIPTTRKMLPPNGVYASVTSLKGKDYPGVTNIGYKPTVGANFRGVETYLFDFDEDLYGEAIQVKLMKFERPERKFDSLEELRDTMHRDIAFGREYFHE